MRIRAYTLMEVLLTLVVSSMLIVFTYTTFLYIDKQLITYQKETISYQNVKIAEKTIKRDVYLCNTIRTTEDQIDLIHYNESIISYRKEGSRLYRKQDNNNEVVLDIPVLKWVVTDTTQGLKHGTLIELTTIVHKDTLDLVFTKQKMEMILKSN